MRVNMRLNRHCDKRQMMEFILASCQQVTLHDSTPYETNLAQERQFK